MGELENIRGLWEDLKTEREQYVDLWRRIAVEICVHLKEAVALLEK